MTAGVRDGRTDQVKTTAHCQYQVGSVGATARLM
jgi:hypothetical protein